MEESGADAMRLYLLSSAATRGEELRFSKEGVQQVVRQTLLPLWNAYNFFVTYALVDEWSPEKIPAEPSPNLLDRWILSRVVSLAEKVEEAMDQYHLYATLNPVLDFVEQLTNWYIRLNRRRFWSGNTEEEREDKLHAYATLHEALCSFSRVLAPLAPFISDEIFRNLTSDFDKINCSSVHLAPFPSAAESGIKTDPELEKSMEVFEEVILLGRGLRNDLGLRVRQPLSEITVVHPDSAVLEGLKQLNGYIKDELNIKKVGYSVDEEGVVDLKALLNTKTLGKVLGPKLGSDGMKELRNMVQGMSTDEIRKFEQTEELSFRDVVLKPGDIIVSRDAKEGADNVSSSGQVTVVLNTNLTSELRLEGLAREFVNRVQKLRKDYDFHVSDRVSVRFMTACPKISTAIEDHSEYVMSETLALELEQVMSESDLNLQEDRKHLGSIEIGDKGLVVSLERIESQ